ncbi:hypothetical protein D8674_003662 [Pyrus ussuriensis x Pyrus communis]|uniref:Uncharacterized protein n=1 Tax=Pyrus ussuriensis x Pyrus communis TaxID=2448454 RepID=A0A5N5FIA9_9ROSA|nr:hypothetical protein D8674_003662 [Pyrus ussuriensis x Pyrus communis]
MSSDEDHGSGLLSFPNQVVRLILTDGTQVLCNEVELHILDPLEVRLQCIAPQRHSLELGGASQVFKDELLIYTEDTRVEDDVIDALQKDVMLCFLTVVLHEEENAKAVKSGQQAGAEVAMKDKLQKEYGKDLVLLLSGNLILVYVLVEPCDYLFCVDAYSRGEFVGDAVEGNVASLTPKVGVLSPSKRIREAFANEARISYLEEMDG